MTGFHCSKCGMFISDTLTGINKGVQNHRCNIDDINEFEKRQDKIDKLQQEIFRLENMSDYYKNKGG